mgnify:CR=1 FL=1
MPKKTAEAQDIKIGFESGTVRVPLSKITPLKLISQTVRDSEKFQQIVASIREVGVIEPPVVAPKKKPADPYLLLDGHLRVEALKMLGESEVTCLISTDDEAFTYNKHISRLSPIQEHRMILEAVKRGVSEEKIARALNLNVANIIRKRNLLDGICPEVVDLLKDKMVAGNAFNALRRMKATRQIEAATHELMLKKEEAERGNHAKTRFLAAASHDLRQPMHAMALYLGELSSLDLPERARRAVGDARLCADDLNDMFRSVLDMAQLDSQAARPQPRPFCVAALLDRVERTFKPLADAEGVDLRVLSRAQWAHSDPAMVERVIMNFTSNALRHARGNRVLVTCRARGDTLRLAVHDNGAGIAPAQQQAIFEAFYRLDTGAHQRHTGFGLGLSIVSRLTHMLDVPLVLRSAPGHGSMFAIDLPRASTNPVPTEEEAS